MLYFRDVLQTVDYNGIEIINIFRSIDFDIIKNSEFLEDYIIQDGETPESIAADKYGSDSYAWIIMIVNSIHNRFFNFPLTDALIQKYQADMLYMGYTQQEIIDFETNNDASRYIKILKPTLLQTLLFKLQDKIAGKE